MANLKMGVSRKQNKPNFPKNKHLLTLIRTCTCAYQRVRNYVFWKIWRARLETRLFILLPTKSKNHVWLKGNLNPFSTNVPLLYPLKTENHWRFSVFRGYRSGTLAENGLIFSYSKMKLNNKNRPKFQ